MQQPNAEKTKPQKRSLETQCAILNAAIIEFSTHGFQGASIRRIATMADVNHGLIKHHFGNKDRLWKAAAESLFARFEERLAARAAGLQGVSEGEFLRLIIREFILHSAEHPELNRFILQANAERERMKWFVDSVVRKSKYSPLTVVERAQETGFFIEGDPVRLYYLFIGAATSIFAFGAEFEVVTGRDPYEPKTVEEHIAMLESIFFRQPPSGLGGEPVQEYSK